MAGRKSKDKGYRGERNLVIKLNENLIKTKRVPLSGADWIKGDVIIEKLGVGEVKLRKNGFAEIYKWLGDNDFLFIKRDNDPYLVVTRIDDWIQLVKNNQLKEE